jgi:hypothetical protein
MTESRAREVTAALRPYKRGRESFAIKGGSFAIKGVGGLIKGVGSLLGLPRPVEVRAELRRTRRVWESGRADEAVVGALAGGRRRRSGYAA